MADTPVQRQTSFVIQKTGIDPNRPPLELYHLSHDLRGPLNSILGFAELLIEGIEGPLNETQAADMAAIYQSARNLLHLINTTVDLSKLEADRLNFNFEAVDVGQVIHDVVAADFGSSKPEQLELVAAAPAGLLPAWGDRDRIAQMITGFIRFALKMKKKGRVVVAAKNDADSVIVWVDLDDVRLPPEEVPELFELVVKLDRAGRSELGRGGLDLPLARRLAEKHNGRAWVESQAGNGLTFYLKLPQQDQS